MKVLKSLEEVESAGLSPPVYAAAHGVLKNLIDAYEKHGETYDPEDDGYVVGPTDQLSSALGELRGRLRVELRAVRTDQNHWRRWRRRAWLWQQAAARGRG